MSRALNIKLRLRTVSRSCGGVGLPKLIAVGKAGVRWLCLVATLGAWATACNAAEVTPGADGALSSRPLGSQSTNSVATLFEALPASRTGIDFVYRWNEAPRYERLLNSSAVGGGVAVGDYNADGLPDVCLTRPDGGYRLYRNLGDFRFTNVTEQAGLKDENVWSTGTTFADVNGDGRLDLYICCYDSPNRLYLNQGDGRFVERAQAAGLDFNGASIMMAFCDYDRDGRLDAYLLTGGLIPQPSQRFRVKFVDGRPVVPEELQEYWQIMYLPGDRAAVAEAGQFDHLYHNDGNSRFTDVSKQAGLSGCDFGNAVIWWDYNADGWPDLYVANDYFGPDHLYRNNRDGTFTDVIRDVLPHTPWTSMGADAADINNDGLIDMIASDMSGTTRFKRMIDMIDTEKSGWFLELAEPRQYMRNALFLNTGLGRFMEVAYLAGVADTDWTWSIVFGDLDSDGLVDLFVPNGMTRDWMDTDLAMRAQALPPSEFARFWRAQPVRADENLAFQNLGNLQFRSTGMEWGLGEPGPSFGAALADLDGDGDLDLVVNQYAATPRVLRNGSTGNHRIAIRLAGRGDNRFGIGATVRIQAAGVRQMRYMSLAHGFMSATEPTVHFGLGQADRVDTLAVEWPGGGTTECHNVRADQLLTICEPAVHTSPNKPAGPPTCFFRRSTALSGARHEEEPFDDFQSQPLLPWRLSQLGPGLAWADVDGDGDDDLYMGGTARKAGALFLNDGHGNLRVDSQQALTALADEMAPLFLDVNADGAVDLFVVTGGAEIEAGAESLRDLLYINDGKGKFTRAPPGALPDLRESGSVAAAADFDRDGDLDIFVGGRLVPGSYPRSPSSRLLRNEGGRFVDATETAAPPLRQAGLVTSAIWSDVDGDGWVDLLVTCEWGPVRFFHNQAGRLVERSREAGLDRLLGWWNGIAAGDIDNDGDIDYVVANLGLNTRYQPGSDTKCRLYYGDFVGDGGLHIIEAIATPTAVLPLRGKSALEKAMPFLGAKFASHHEFASATLADILGPKAIESAGMLEANMAESIVLRNLGDGRFSVQPMPRLAQDAPAFGVTLAEVDGDGKKDIVLAQNFHSPQRETGRMDGGVGLVLLGRGDGSFEPVWPNRSGVMIPGDARSLAVADFNCDGRPDFVAGINNGEPQAFENTAGGANRFFAVQLRGRRGNPHAVGARIGIVLGNGETQTAEVYAGGGYLSQSESTVRFGLGPTGQVDQVKVRWPLGTTSTVRPPAGQASIQINED